jgi:hypothetical protein
MIRWPATVGTPILLVLAILGSVAWIAPVLVGILAVGAWIIHDSITNNISTPWG